MLSRIHVQNFAIATEAEIELADGMSVLTGETGAGKSILIDALDLVLGDRADSSVVRHGADRATINATFTLQQDSPALQWLQEQELDDGDECHLRRVISSEGRSRAFINNAPANLSALKTLGEMLIEIHGQHEHQGLMKAVAQRQQLDSAGDYDNLLDDVAHLARELETCSRRLRELTGNLEENRAQLELLRYQINELETLNLNELDIPELLQEHEQISNIDSLRSLTFNLQQQLSDNEEHNITQQLGELITQLEPWQETSEELNTAASILLDATALTQEAGKSIQQLQDRLESDPQRIEELDKLFSQLHELARKHHCTMTELPGLYREKNRQLQQIDHDSSSVAALEQQSLTLQQDYLTQAEALHSKRTHIAEQLSNAVTENMQQLGMQGGVFKIDITRKAESQQFPPHGLDEVCYMVSANPGQPLQPLHKVASGGELSRISLAISVICASATNASTMIFDEVDSGIGGGVAEIVGRQLSLLANQRQVLCVTHLPQVAAQGKQHFRVVKTSTDEYTESRVIKLDSEARVQEIARMLGGVEITEQSLAHASELLDLSTAKVG